MILSLPFFSAVALAQSEEAPKVEVGVQFSSLSITPPGQFQGTENKPGFGGRVTYNLTDNVAVEAEGNFFPTLSRSDIAVGGRTLQLQAGIKAGKRYERFGIFARARPGLVSFGEVFQIGEGQSVPDGAGGVFIIPSFSRVRRNHFSMDVGGVLEIYPSRNTMVRFDAGDTIIRYGERTDFGSFPPFLPVISTAPSTIKHNFQFSAGIGYRFGGGPEPAPADDASDGERKLELGVQFSSLILNEPDRFIAFPAVVGSPGTDTEAGFGARIGYNFNEHVAVEAEGNFYPRRRYSDATTGGYPVQLQAGVKAGRRYERFGIFARARPGFVGFSDVNRLERVDFITLDGIQYPFPVYDTRWKNYFSMDVGGVVELYPSKRFLTRFDFGDTMIHYGDRQDFALFGTSLTPIALPSQTKHSFQFSAGIGYRF